MSVGMVSYSDVSDACLRVRCGVVTSWKKVPSTTLFPGSAAFDLRRCPYFLAHLHFQQDWCKPVSWKRFLNASLSIQSSAAVVPA